MSGFDLVLGNPPYVASYSRQSHRSVEDIVDTMLISSFTLRLIEGHEAFSGRTNYFLCFLSVATKIIHRRGKFGLVLPDTILTNESYTPMRRALLSAGMLAEATLFVEPVFPGATVGTATVTGGASPESNRQVTLTRCTNTQGTASGECSRFTVRSNELLERPRANLQPEAVSSQYQTANSIALGEIAEIKDGINPGPREVRDRILSDSPQGDNPRRVLVGGDIVPFGLNWSGKWVDYSESKITKEEKKAGTSLRQSWIFERPKIVYRQTAPLPIAAVDTENFCVLNSVHCILLKEHNDDLLWALCAYLNSSVCKSIYQSRTGETRKVFPQVHISAMRELPVPFCLSDVSSPFVARLSALARQAAIAVHSDEGSRAAPIISGIIAEVDKVVASEMSVALTQTNGDKSH